MVSFELGIINEKLKEGEKKQDPHNWKPDKEIDSPLLCLKGLKF